MKIAVTTSSFAEYDPQPLKLLQAQGLEVALNPYRRSLTAAEAAAFLSGCTAVLAGTEPLTAEVLGALPDLRVISRCGAGLDNVDMAFAKSHGLLVYSTPDGPTRAVVELTLALALDLVRQISRQDRGVRAGAWSKWMGRLLAGQKVAVVGYGRIGRGIAQVFRALGCEAAVYDPYVQAEDLPNMPLPELLAWCDGVTLHCPKSPDGKAVLDAEALAILRPGAWLINAARGGLVDEAALYEALKSGRLAAAALDVFGKEPYDGPLRELDNVVLTPHVGSYAREARVQMEMEAAENLLRGLGFHGQ